MLVRALYLRAHDLYERRCLVLRIRVGRASELLKPDDEVMLIEIGNVKLVKKLDLAKLLEELPELSEEDADKLGLEAKKWSREQL